MAGGSTAQAKRRSETEAEDTSTVNVDGNEVRIQAAMPNQEELIQELVKKRCGGNREQKITNIVKPIVDDRELILSTVQRESNEAMATKIGEVIPVSLPKTTPSAPAIAQMMLSIHSAVKTYTESCHRPSRQVLSSVHRIVLANGGENARPHGTRNFGGVSASLTVGGRRVFACPSLWDYYATFG